MKKPALFLLLTLLLCTGLLNSQHYDMSNSNLGTDFWIAIPQNEDTVVAMKGLTLDIYVLSYEDAMVTMEIPSTGKTVTKNLTAFTPAVFTSRDGDLGFDMEVRESETATDKGIHIYSTSPIAVSVLSDRAISAEGYLALPVSSLGKKYIHSSVTDLNEGQNWRAGGFLIVAPEDNTNLIITIRGKGESDLSKTYQGKKIGEKILAKLNKGQTFYVRGNGRTRDFDMTGTLIEANKPIGVISMHMRAMLPYNVYEGRQMLAEMVLPIDAWGKQFVSLDFIRKRRGDMFKLVCSEDNTEYNVKYYDTKTKAKIGELKGTLAKAGDYFEYNAASIESGVTNESVKGIAYWTTTKPSMLMQLSYSKEWDDDNVWKPLMIMVPPVEQYLQDYITMAPIAAGYNLNDMSIFAVGDPKDSQNKLLYSILLNGYTLDGIEDNNIPDTKLYWIRDNILGGKGSRHIESQTKVGGTINGYSQQNLYGMPQAIGTNYLEVPDPNAPIITKTMLTPDENSWKITVTETRLNESNNGQPENSGISKFVILKDDSYNYVLSYEPFAPQDIVRSLDVEFTRPEPGQASKAVFAAIDRAGNIRKDSIVLAGGEEESLFAYSWDAGQVMIGKSICYDEGLRLENRGTTDITVTGIEGVAAPFSIKSPQQPAFPFVMQPASVVLFMAPCFEPTDTLYHEIEVTFLHNGTGTTKSKWAGKGFIPSDAPEEIPNGIRIKNNPSFGDDMQISISPEAGNNIELTIYDSQGLPIRKLNPGSPRSGSLDIILDSDEFSSGVYFMRVTIDEQTSTYKLMFIR